MRGLLRPLRSLAMTYHLLCNHYPREMGFARAAADRVIFMDEGCIVEEATPDVFFTNPKEARTQRFLSWIL